MVRNGKMFIRKKLKKKIGRNSKKRVRNSIIVVNRKKWQSVYKWDTLYIEIVCKKNFKKYPQVQK